MDPSLNESSYLDSHAHINLLHDSPVQLGIALKQKRVKWVVVPGFDLKSSQEAVELAKDHAWILPAAGIHPHDAFPDWSPSLRFIREKANNREIIAIGEIGLDGVRSNSLPQHQIALLEEQLQIAEDSKLPVLIHNREKDSEIEAILGHFPSVKGVLHCYSSPEKLALTKAKEGWLISFSFNITYSKSDYLRTLIRKLPLSSLLLETDSPYLSPLEDRGKRENTPLNIPALYQWLSDWLSIPLETICEQLIRNFMYLFSLDSAG